MVAAYAAETPDARRAGFHVIKDEDTPLYDTQAQPTERSVGFAVIPAALFALGDGTCLAVYAVLAKHANKDGMCWPSMKRMEEALGWSDNRIRPALKRLIDDGFVTVEKRKLNGMDQSNVYKLQPNVQVSRDRTPVSHDRVAVSRSGALGIPPQDSGYPATGHEQDPIELEPIEQDPPVVPQGTSAKPSKRKPDDGESFQVFWKAYLANDKHGRSKKPDTLRIWSGLSEAERGDALAAIPLFAAGRDWRDGFVPGAQVWLRGRKWENPPEPVSSNGAGPHLPPGFVLPAGVSFKTFQDWIAYRKAGLSMPDERNVLVDRYLAAMNGMVLA